MSATSYREAVDKITKPLDDREKKLEMLAMFLCDSGIIPLPGNGGSRLSGGHGWHRTSEDEREQYRRIAGSAIGHIQGQRIDVKREN